MCEILTTTEKQNQKGSIGLYSLSDDHLNLIEKDLTDPNSYREIYDGNVSENAAETIDLMSKTVAQHVRLEAWCISLPFFQSQSAT